MKKQSIQNIAKKLFFGNLLMAAMFLSANASTLPVKTTSLSAFAPVGKVDVKYTGIDLNNQLSFTVNYSNATGSTFHLSILDQEGEVLYKNYFDNKNFSRTFKLPKSELSKVTFVIEDKKNAVTEKFTVNINTKVTEEVIVSKG
jgi:hypothetical protein